VKLRKRYLPVAAALGVAVAIVPALAAGTPAPSEVKLEVNENCYFPEWPCWNVKGNNPDGIRQIQPFTIAQGGTISFEDNDSKALTDVIWEGAAPSCTAGVPEASPTKTGWSGTCTFPQAGEYVFESEGLFNDGTFDYTKYKVIVEKPGGGTTSTTTTTTTPTTTTPTTTTPTTTTPTTSTPTTTTPTMTMPTTTPTPTTLTATPSQPYGGGTATAATPGSTEPSPRPTGSLPTLALASAQRGDAVHGTVKVPTADGGARLEVALLTQGASLAKVRRSGSSRVGRLVRSSVPAGMVSFTVALDAAAKRALRQHRMLALTVKIVLRPKHGAAMTLTRNVVLR
jgi:hypothetical protein